MNNEKQKTPWLRVLGISLVFAGLLYLEAIKPELKASGYDILVLLAKYLPMQKRLLLYWFLFAVYVALKNVKNGYAIGFKLCVWANFIALGIAWIFMVIYDGVPLQNVLPYMKGIIPGTTGSYGWGWLVYFGSFIGSIFGIAFVCDYIFPSVDRDEVHIRGKRLLNIDHARAIANQKVATDGPGVTFGWLNVPESQTTTHFAVVGATGSGKTLIIRNLMESALPRIKKGSDCRALIYDPKRDMLPILSGMKLEAEIVTLHPFDKRGAAWDMAKDITSPASADHMATILIPHEKQSSSPFFPDAARALMTGVLTVFIKKCPEVWTFRDLIVALKNSTRLRAVLSECEETKDLVEQYFSNERTANDVMSTLATKIQRYQYVAAAWDKAERKISLKDWAAGSYVLVLGNDEETRTAVDALNQIIFKRVSEMLLNQSESFTRRSWLIIDELKEAGPLPGLTSALSKGRSKGICAVIGFQDIEGLGAALSDNRIAHEIVGLCANKALLRLDSAETAKWASSQFGEQEIELKKVSSTTGSSSTTGKVGGSTSDSTSESWQNMKRDAVMAAQFLDLPPVERTGVLHGYYIVPSVGSYYAGIRMSGESSILGGLRSPDSDCPGYLERDKEAQTLRPWGNTDIERLALSSSALRNATDVSMHELDHAKENSVGQTEDFNPLERIKRS